VIALDALTVNVPTVSVFVHAHPDDETLWTGALIATAAQRGDRVIVITCTRGERGEVITAPGTATENLGHLFGDYAALAVYRTTEIRAALAALGPNIEHHFLDELPLPSVVSIHLLSVGTRPTGTATASSPAVTNPVDLVAAQSRIERRIEPVEMTTGSMNGNACPTRYEDSGMIWLIPPHATDDPQTSTGGIAGPDPTAPAGFAIVPIDEPAVRLANFLTQLDDGARTTRVVTYEKDGGYGHPDHVRAHQVTTRALELLPPTVKTELWEVTKPGEPCDVEIPVAPVLPKLLTAMRAYASQVQGVRENVANTQENGPLGWFALSNGVPLPIRTTENYRIVQ